MYIPFDYWNVLLTSPQTKGKRGGLQITYENVGRYLNNTFFVNLVKDGGIGSPAQANSQLSQLIKAGLEGKRSVVFAIETQNINTASMPPKPSQSENNDIDFVNW